jgi:hypothetical protein
VVVEARTVGLDVGVDTSKYPLPQSDIGDSPSPPTPSPPREDALTPTTSLAVSCSEDEWKAGSEGRCLRRDAAPDGR